MVEEEEEGTDEAAERLEEEEERNRLLRRMKHQKQGHLKLLQQEGKGFSNIKFSKIIMSMIASKLKKEKNLANPELEGRASHCEKLSMNDLIGHIMSSGEVKKYEEYLVSTNQFFSEETTGEDKSPNEEQL